MTDMTVHPDSGGDLSPEEVYCASFVELLGRAS